MLSPCRACFPQPCSINNTATMRKMSRVSCKHRPQEQAHAKPTSKKVCDFESQWLWIPILGSTTCSILSRNEKTLEQAANLRAPFVLTCDPRTKALIGRFASSGSSVFCDLFQCKPSTHATMACVQTRWARVYAENS